MQTATIKHYQWPKSVWCTELCSFEFSVFRPKLDQKWVHFRLPSF
jgi:hypothetical protein